MSKKVWAVLLSVVMLLGCFGVGFAGANAQRTVLPTVYVEGQGMTLYYDGTNPASGVIPDYFDPALVTEGIPALSGALLDAYRKNDFTDYNNQLVALYAGYFEDIALDENGEASDGSGNQCNQWIPTYDKKSGGTYSSIDYQFIYDWRLDPVVVASQLNTFIDAVLSVTHAEKVNIVGRCLGGNITLAYLREYGCEKVNAVCFYAAGMQGFDLLGALYSGQVEINPDSLERFMNVMSAKDPDNEMFLSIREFISVMNNGLALNIGIKEIMDLYNKIYEDVVPRMLAVSFGSCPSYWSMVGDEYFDAGVKFNYEGKPEYEEMVRKITYYHNEVYKKTEQILTDAQTAGVKVYFVAKYGEVAIPVFKESEEQNDGYVSTRSMSMGCTAAGMGKTFSDAYMKQARKDGTEKYISADRQIDASTCFAPDHTWFVKDLDHKKMPASVDDLIMTLLDADHYMTVDDDPACPQFIKYDRTTEQLSPLTEENQQGDDEQHFDSDKIADTISVMDKIMEFFEKISDYLMSLFERFLALFARFAA